MILAVLLNEKRKNTFPYLDFSPVGFDVYVL
jgi:hypothetical protein